MESIAKVLSRIDMLERLAEVDRIRKMTPDERMAEYQRIYKEQQHLDPNGPEAEKYIKNALTLEVIIRTIPSM